MVVFLGLLVTVLPPAAWAQAGSSKPVLFTDTPRGSSGPAPVLPDGVLKLPREERFLLWVNLAEGRLKILEQDAAGGLALRQELPVSIGKNGYGKQEEGDQKTPVGIYRLTSFLRDDMLIDFYGLGAFTLNYPNVSDRRARRTGSGIWLHGLPKGIDERPLRDSDGCVVIDNDSLAAMDAYITTGLTHVVLADRPLDWVAKQEADSRIAGLEQAFEAWRQAWEARDNGDYLAFYAADFSDFNRDRRAWAEYKTQVNYSKTWIRVGTSKVSYFTEPGDPALVTVRYYQDYESNNYRWRGWKEQLWRQGPDHWEIVYEGNG